MRFLPTFSTEFYTKSKENPNYLIIYPCKLKNNDSKNSLFFKP